MTQEIKDFNQRKYHYARVVAKGLLIQGKTVVIYNNDSCDYPKAITTKEQLKDIETIVGGPNWAVSYTDRDSLRYNDNKQLTVVELKEGDYFYWDNNAGYSSPGTMSIRNIRDLPMIKVAKLKKT